MNNILVVILSISVVVYLTISGLAVPVYFLEQHNAERECAKAYGVYACEKVEQWKPAQIGVPND